MTNNQLDPPEPFDSSTEAHRPPAEFRSYLSHQLRAPLTCIDGALRLIDSSEVKLSAGDLQQLISVARNSTRRLVTLVDDLLDSSAARPASDTSETTAQRQSPFDGNGQPVRVLMIEDDLDYECLIRQQLSCYQTDKVKLRHVVSISLLEEELQICCPDVIVLDLSLPDAEGVATVRAVRNICRRIPIVVLTGADDREMGLEALQHGADDFLVKQHTDTNSLMRAIRYAVTRKRYEESTLRAAAIKDFANTLAHDMMVPLTGVRDVLNMLSSGKAGPLGAQQADLITCLAKSTQDQLRLVDKLLEVYRYDLDWDEVPFEAIHLGDIVPIALRDLQKVIPLQDRVVIDLPSELPMINGNRQALAKLLFNLLHNALVHGEQSGTVRLHCQLTEGAMRLHIHNWGAQLPEDIAVNSQESFWQGTPGKIYVAKTGLGLYLARRLAALHGGQISFASNDKSGTTVTVQLPLLKD